MKAAALITWTATALAGLYLLATWLIEYDFGAPGATASRLPKTVIGGHVLLAVSGLGVWLAYILTDRTFLAWTVLGMLLTVATLGSVMLGRWVQVRRAITGTGPRRVLPAESQFPVTVVTAHGLFAVSTLTLVVVTCVATGGL